MRYDAHNHLQDERLRSWRAQGLATLPAAGLAEAVVNGTREADWPAVAALARAHAWVRPAFGLHPWFVRERSPDWLATLRAQLLAFPGAAVGEIGLDRWIENPDLEAQEACLRAQLALAVELDRPACLHCLRAWGWLGEVLHSCPLPRRGFLLHSYAGPAEMVPQFAALGAYFSLSPYFAHPRKAAQLEVFCAVPANRLLAETDAPDMRPPEAGNPHPLSADGEPINDPANLSVSYALLARLRGLEPAALEALIAANHQRLFH